MIFGSKTPNPNPLPKKGPVALYMAVPGDLPPYEEDLGYKSFEIQSINGIDLEFEIMNYYTYKLVNNQGVIIDKVDQIIVDFDIYKANKFSGKFTPNSKVFDGASWAGNDIVLNAQDFDGTVSTSSKFTIDLQDLNGKGGFNYSNFVTDLKG
jgi:hypothetical protein